MLILRRPSRFSRPPAAKHARWIYLGVEQSNLAACRKACGEDSRLDVTENFHSVARELKGPFLDEIARIGSLQSDPLGWHASSFALKNPTASELFTLACYRALLERLARDREETILVFIEDPWLYAQCRKDVSEGRLAAQCGTRAPMGPLKLRLLLRAGLARSRWLARTVLGLARHLRFGGLTRYAPDHQDFLLYSSPHPRCLVAGGGWKDPFLGNLDGILGREGRSVGWLVPTGAFGYEAEVAQRAGYVHALTLEATWASLWRSFTAFWRPSVDRFTVAGIDLPLLAQREWWVDLGYARWCEYRLFYESALRLLARLRPTAVIYPYENLSWERMLVSAAKVCGVFSVGYQHALIGEYEMNYYLGAGGARHELLPDLIMTAGETQRGVLVSQGTPESLCRVAGSLRYSYLFDAPGACVPSRKKVLVPLGHQRAPAEALLDALNETFPDHGAAEGLSFHLRPHPTSSFIDQGKSSWMPLVQGELVEQLPQFDVVLGTGGTPIIEGLMLGIPGVVYRPETVVDSTDASHLLPEGSALIATRANLRRQVCHAAGLGRTPISTQMSRSQQALFAPVDEQSWRNSLPRPGGALRIENKERETPVLRP